VKERADRNRKRLLLPLAALLAAALPAAARAQTPTPTPLPIVPLLDEVTVNPSTGLATAYLGYRNPNTRAVSLRIESPVNFFSPLPEDRGQRDRFLPGEHRRAFAAVWDYREQPQITWILNGSSVTADSAAALAALPTAFTYQGRLTDAGAPADGVYDLQFTLYAGEARQGDPVVREDVAVTRGVFTVTLDFGSEVFAGGAARHLAIGVRPGASTGEFTLLEPRQPITATPYAVRTVSAARADRAGVAEDAEKLGGVAASLYVLGADARLSNARTPTAGSPDYIQNGTTPQPGASFNVAGGGAIGGDLSVGGKISGDGSGLTNVLRVIPFVSSVNGFVAGANSTQFVFTPGQVTLTTAAGQRVTGTATAPFLLSLFNTGTSEANIGLCYRSTAAGGSVRPFPSAEGLESAPVYSVDQLSRPYTASASFVPGAGTWEFGLCIKNGGSRPVTGLQGSGWFLLTRD
jgi:hypothetical protein